MLIAIAAVTMLWHLAGWTQALTTFQDGEPARASEVNDNFAALKAKIEALEQDLEALTPFQHPDRYYPNWRSDPDFYLTLPLMAGSWAGFLSDDDDYWYWTDIYFPGGSPGTPTSNTYEKARYNINLMANTGGENPERIWAGAFVRRAPDIDAQHKAEHLAGVVSPDEPSHTGDLMFYHVRLSHHINQNYAIFNYSKDTDLSYGGSGDSDWQYAMPRSMVESVLTGFYALLDLTSTTHVKHCSTINLHLNLDYSVDVTSPDCTSVPLNLP
jgi:hypothetical protein